MLPKGLATFLPDAALQKRHIEEAILGVITSWGYQEVIPPIFEYLDVITRGMGEDLIEKGYKFVDRANGRLMLLRPDVTPQIARMAAMLMPDAPKPLRLCYRANVFRHEEEHAGRARELFQIGVELIGPAGPEADAEIIAIAVEALQKIGLSRFKVALGQVAFFQGLIESLEIPSGLRKPIEAALSRKDRAKLDQLVSMGRIAEKRMDPIRKLLTLFGQEEVIETALKLTPAPACRAALKHLREVVRILVSRGWEETLLIDLAEVRGSDYYTGVIFELFSRDLGVPLGRGGRYDSLIGKFGAPCPSTGFAFNLEQLQWALQKSGRGAPASPVDFLVLDMEQDSVRLFQTARMIREKGYRVIQQAEKSDLDSAVERARMKGIRNIFVTVNGQKAVLIDCRQGGRKMGRVQSLMAAL